MDPEFMIINTSNYYIFILFIIFLYTLFVNAFTTIPGTEDVPRARGIITDFILLIRATAFVLNQNVMKRLVFTNVFYANSQISKTHFPHHLRKHELFETPPPGSFFFFFFF